jgi:hypothetical protein
MSSRSWKAAAASILIVAGAGLAVAHAESSPDSTPSFMHHMGPGMMNGMMNNMGPGMMGMQGMGMAHDSATMAQLADIHDAVH